MSSAIIGALLSALGFGTANIVIKKALGSLSTAQTLSLSMAAGVFFLTILSLINAQEPDLNRSIIISMALLGLGETALYLTLYKSLAVSDVTVAIAVLSTYPVLSTIYTIVFLDQPSSSLQLVFIVLMVIGGIVVSLDWNEVRKQGLQAKDFERGLGWILLCLLIHALYFPILSDFTAEGIWQIKLLGVKFFAVVFLVIIFALIQGQTIRVSMRKLPYVVLLGFLEIMGWVGLSWASNNSEGLTAVIIAIGSSAPIVTAILAYYFLAERISKIQYLGILIIIAALVGLSLS